MEKTKEERRINRLNWVQIFAFILIIVSGGIIITWQITEKVNSCTSDPIQYFADNYDDMDLTFESVSIYFYLSSDDVVPTLKVPKNLTSKD